MATREHNQVGDKKPPRWSISKKAPSMEPEKAPSMAGKKSPFNGNLK